MIYCQVTLIYPNGSKQNDVAVSRETLKAVKEYVAMRVEELSAVKFTVAKISKAACEELVDSGAIDWTR